MADVHTEAEKDYILGMKYKDIATKYGVSEATVKSWKTRYGWIRKKKRKVHTKAHTKSNAETIEGGDAENRKKEELRIIYADDELNDKQKQFCVFLHKKHNITKAYMCAYGVDYATAAAAGSRLLKNVKIRAYLEMLKNERQNMMCFDEEDLVQRYMDIAFADVGDVAIFTNDGIRLRENFDPTTVKKIKQTKHGYEIEMMDAFKAMEWLDKYFEVNPQHKRRREYEELRKAQLEQEIAESRRREQEDEKEKEEYGTVILAEVKEEETEEDE